MQIGGKSASLNNSNPLTSFRFYVDFRGFLRNLAYMVDAASNENIDALRDAIDRTDTLIELEEDAQTLDLDEWEINESKKKKQSYEEEKSDLVSQLNKELENVTIENVGEKTAKFNLSSDTNWEDFTFMVKDVTLPKYVMKSVKRNQMDIVKTYPIKTSYGGETSITMTSTFGNISKLSKLMGLFNKVDKLGIWNNVYFVESDFGNVDSSVCEYMCALDIVLVAENCEDVICYRLINPIVTNIDFGSFAYGTNAFNEIRMNIIYNSWYTVRGKYRPSSERDSSGWDTWDQDALNWINGVANEYIGGVAGGFTNKMMDVIDWSKNFWNSREKDSFKKKENKNEGNTYVDI